MGMDCIRFGDSCHSLDHAAWSAGHQQSTSAGGFPAEGILEERAVSVFRETAYFAARGTRLLAPELRVAQEVVTGIDHG